MECVSASVKSCDFISSCVKPCKCKNKYIYMILHDHEKYYKHKKNTLTSFEMTMLNNVNVNQCKKCDFYLRKRDFIIFL